MKKISILILAGITLLNFYSCIDDEGPEFIIQEESATAPVIVTANTTVTLNKEVENNQALTVVWNDADYNFQTPVSYSIMVANAGTNFENAIEAASTVERSYTWTVKDLNDLAIKTGLVIDEEGALEVRVISSLGSNDGVAMNSNILAITLTPYSTELPRLWLPGDYAQDSGYGANWNPSDPATPTLIAENFTSSKFEGYVFFANDNSNFKITPTNVNFDGNFGDTNDSGTSGTLLRDDASKNIVVPIAGYYKINVDIEALTYTLTKTEWAITGSSTPLGFAPAEPGPDQDHDLTYDKDTKVWTTTLDLSSGEIKFRANDAWSLNYGNDDNGDGSLDEGGSNIAVASGGTFLIALDFSEPRGYSFMLTPVTN
ncbi:SusE domain-containing protein [Aquimarina sp. U1-2]|uniref:SusE domain-containing protein n=1 Tax=Aquimarina sp. U1-2 TaxID=2823141 RepID=UPI001AECD671|nr:SusE domain-containing protein [Aquimarina sp. U1-2]MBP2833601.1 SusE domain-containing protein [Aquimarina sp. U1-2]